MPTSPIDTPGGAGGSIFGRERELARLDELIDGVRERGAALLVRGEAGIGKSTLLAATSRRAEAAGMQVLRTTGVQYEALLPFAGLHQLVLPVLGQTDRLPAPQQTALLAAFGMTEAAAPDRFLIALAVLELLSDAAERAPLLVVADDAQWLDRSTAGVLGFVARRVEHEPIGSCSWRAARARAASSTMQDCPSCDSVASTTRRPGRCSTPTVGSSRPRCVGNCWSRLAAIRSRW
jgi:predicted ATPase